MEVLEYTKDGKYTVRVSSTEIDFAWNKFRVRVGNPHSYCKYELSKGGSLKLYDYQTKRLEEVAESDWDNARPVLFETNIYTISITFTDVKTDETNKPQIIHQSREVEEMFQCVKLQEAYLISSTINFLNQPGRFAVDITYTTNDGMSHKDTIAFDVVSPKLDTKTDLNTIIREIKAEYGNLVFRYLTLTFQQFRQGREANNELIWLSVFKQIINSYIMAIMYVLNRPHNQTIINTEYRKAEKIKVWTPTLEDRFANDKIQDIEKSFQKHYRIEVAEATNDTRENRFVKYTLERISERLKVVIGKITPKDDTKGASDNELTLLNEKLEELKKIQSTPFFRTIGRFDGFKQESLVMQQRQGYSQVYRYWLMLQNGLDLIDGNTSVSVQPIWKLYELWCFLKVKNLICEIMNIDIHKAEDQKFIKKQESDNYDPFNGGDLTGSVNLHYKDNIEDYVEIGYQYVYDRKKERINNATSMTVEQKPDIVVNIHRKSKDFVLTYLFDAKYRVNGASDSGIAIDEPIPETLNQMHRYRDAIYYGQKKEGNFAKEVIGAYILFPGRLKEQEYLDDISKQKPYYIQSIDDVNIGAFPLLPNKDSGLFLKEQLKKIIIGNNVLNNLRKETVPQKGLRYEDLDVNFLIATAFTEVGNNLSDLKNGDATKFFFSEQGPSKIVNLSNVKYLVPVIEQSFYGYYEIKSIKFDNEKKHNCPYKFEIELGDYHSLNGSIQYGINEAAVRGIMMNTEQFNKYCKENVKNW